MSCVYYVQIGDDSDLNNGSTYFLRPFNRGFSHKDFAGLRYNKSSTHFKAEEGKLLIWPSFIMHGSKPYLGKKDRIIISANADIDIGVAVLPAQVPNVLELSSVAVAKLFNESVFPVASVAIYIFPYML